MYKCGAKLVLSFFLAFIFTTTIDAQCSICTKTAAQMGKESGTGLNGGILYLMLAPFAIGGYIGYRWWKQERKSNG